MEPCALSERSYPSYGETGKHPKRCIAHSVKRYGDYLRISVFASITLSEGIMPDFI